MSSMRTAFLLAASMAAASVGAMIATPKAKLADEQPAVSLEKMIPLRFGDWSEQPLGHLHVVNPQAQEVLDRIYSQVLSRVYVNSSGYRVMLSLAYGSDQRRGLQAHKPEVCYPAQGFVVERNEPGEIATAFGSLPVRRLFTRLQSRQEPVTYWFTVGDTAVLGKTEKRLVDLRYGLTGRIPDGMLFRVSSIDADQRQAFALQARFITELLAVLPPVDRKRLSGLGTAPAP
jgi:EpsI family protein